MAAEFDVYGVLHIGCALPAAWLRRDGSDRLRLLHPDAVSPRSVGESDDGRVLAVALRRLSPGAAVRLRRAALGGLGPGTGPRSCVRI
ncbi:MAG: hypothetical protein WDN04_00355 [Rhodospirillales bacterium]